MAPIWLREWIQKTGEKPSFWRILYGTDLSSDYLRLIPQDFVRSIWDNFRYRVILKVASGDYWRIPLSINVGNVYMNKLRWEEFLEDNALTHNDFLTFTHEGDMCLSVKIFKTDGLETQNPVNLRTPRRHETTPASGNAKVFGVVKIEVESETNASSGTDLRRKKTSRPKIQKRTAQKFQGSSSCSRIPSFIVEIKKSYLNFLAIPKSFAVTYLPMETTKMIIHDPPGRSWEVKYICKRTYQTFSRGWSKVAKTNKLECGDRCKFELIEDMEMRMSVLKND